jgi:hypothetical protein
MDDTLGTSGPLGGYTSDYVKRLLIERLYVYAKLYNPGGSIILRASDIVDHDRPVGYSTEIGNMFHLDLIEIQKELDSMLEAGEISKEELKALLTWADGMTSDQAANYLHSTGGVAIRKRRERALKKVGDKMQSGREG